MRDGSGLLSSGIGGSIKVVTGAATLGPRDGGHDRHGGRHKAGNGGRVGRKDFVLIVAVVAALLIVDRGGLSDPTTQDVGAVRNSER